MKVELRYFALLLTVFLNLGCSKDNAAQTPPVSASKNLSPSTSAFVDVCARKWVGTALLNKLHKQQCKDITAADLLTVQDLELADQPNIGDLQGLPNLKTLTIHLFANYGHNFTAELFEGLVSLETLLIDGSDSAAIRLYEGAFRMLPNLKKLELRGGASSYAISSGRIYDGAFDGLTNIETIDFTGPCYEPHTYVWGYQRDAFRGISVLKLHYNSPLLTGLISSL